MSKNRVLTVSIVLALLVAAFSLWQVVSTKAASAAQADRSYDSVESLRSIARGMPGVAASNQADRSYDAVESIRQNRNAPATALQSGKCLDDECSYQLANGQWVR